MKCTKQEKLRSIRKRLFCFSLLALLPLLPMLISCVKTANGKRALIFMPQSQMHAMGAKAYVDMRKKEKVSTNPTYNKLVTRIGTHIAKASGANYQWAFTVFDSKQVNAFCLPGGKIGVYTGILPVSRTEAGLAAIMGHEVAHATLRHGAQRMSQNVLLQFGLSASGLALKNNKYQKYIMGALGLGAQYGVLLPYGRAHELEADRLGLEYMAKAGYKPDAAVGLWLRMNKLGKAGPEFLSTHPDSKRRAEALRAYIPKVMPLYRKSAKYRDRFIPMK